MCSNAYFSAYDLKEFIRGCRGMFPLQILETLNSLNLPLDPLLSQENLQENQENKVTLFSSFINSTWDFTSESSEFIADEILKNETKVLSLGAPSIFNHTNKIKDSSQHVLIDLGKNRAPNKPYVTSLKYDIDFLCGKEFTNAFDGCVLDPPWYLEHYLHWIKIANDSCKIGKKIIFPLFGALTRPTAVDDRNEIINFCEKLGLKPQVHEEKILYSVPTFEAEILKRAKFPVFDWKLADLVICTKLKETDFQENASVYPKQNKTLIKQIEFKNGLIDIALDRYTESGPMWTTPQGGFLMTTTSARDVGNTQSNLFTSEGKRLICNRPIDFISNLPINTIEYSYSINDGILEVFP